jgi:hypothetical protein
VGLFYIFYCLVIIGIYLGAHLPDMSSEEGLFDILYLGVFIILSAAFDLRFYQDLKPPSALTDEISNAVAHFYSLLHTFSSRFIIVLEGEPVVITYFLDRMLAEFAAASVIFYKAVRERSGGMESSEEKGVVSSSMFIEHIEAILKQSRPTTFSYYLHCLKRSHKAFVWTGPNLQILPRSQDILSIIHLISTGELLDHPAVQIYPIVVEPTPSNSPNVEIQAGKRRSREDSGKVLEEPLKKRNRRS